MPQQKINLEQSAFAPAALLEFFLLDGRSVGLSTIYYFHSATNNNYKAIVFNGISYTPFPVKVEGYEFRSDGSLPRPKVTLSNMNGFVSNILLGSVNLIGAQFIRRRVYARYIDAVNFPNNQNPYGTPDPTAAYPDEIFFVNRKVTENSQVVQFELATSLDLEQAQLPNRQVLSQICPFRFRDPDSCSYAGAPVSDRNNKTFLGAGGYAFISLTDRGAYNSATTYAVGDYVFVTSVLPKTLGDQLFYVCNVAGTVGEANGPIVNPGRWLADACSKTIAGCKLHFQNQPLKFGGFPGISRAQYSFT